MLNQINLNQVPHKEIFLVFGTRSQKDLLYSDELKTLQAEIPGFQFIPTLSREQWDGCCGYVHEVYENLIRERMNGTALPPANFYLCGWKMMVDEARKRIAELGYDRKSVHLELYG